MSTKKSKVPVKSTKDSAVESKSVWQPLLNLREEVDHLIEEFQEGWPFGQQWSTPRGKTPFDFHIKVPAIDVVEKKTAVEVKAELPGMDEADIEVELSDRLLTISGEKREEREEGEKEGNYYLSERSYGSFKRSLSIPDGVDADKVEASFSKGVLTVTLPKTPEAQEKTRKIVVKGTA